MYAPARPELPNRTPTQPSPGAMDQYSTLILIALMVVAFYFLIMRPQRRRQQEVQRSLSALTPGQRVMLGSGLFGTIVSVGQKQVVLEISPGTELTVLSRPSPGWSPRVTRTPRWTRPTWPTT